MSDDQSATINNKLYSLRESPRGNIEILVHSRFVTSKPRNGASRVKSLIRVLPPADDLPRLYMTEWAGAELHDRQLCSFQVQLFRIHASSENLTSEIRVCGSEMLLRGAIVA
jgi:hypothetical protein